MKNTLNLEEIAVSSISTAEDINDAVHVIADNRVGICPFIVNKSNVADMLLWRFFGFKIQTCEFTKI